jgi:iron-sulfur cluster repair protein YtfE (RIC family)
MTTQFAQKLGQHHEACEKLVAAGEAALDRSDWDEFSRAVDAIRDALLLHFEFEEEELFPAFERSSGMRQFTQELCMQHGEMRAILDTLVSVSPRHDPEGCRTEFDTLALLFRQHRAREEEVMYPAIERTLGSAKLPAAKRMRAAEEPGAMDLRGLEPPQPMVKIFEALERSPGTPLRAILPHEPVPLYNLLREHGFKYRGSYRADGGFELVIERA